MIGVVSVLRVATGFTLASSVRPARTGSASCGATSPWCARQDRPHGEVVSLGELLFRAALLRTTRTRFRVRGSPVTYAAFMTVAEDTQYRFGALHSHTSRL
jgi:hypothetical protein